MSTKNDTCATQSHTFFERVKKDFIDLSAIGLEKIEREREQTRSKVRLMAAMIQHDLDDNFFGQFFHLEFINNAYNCGLY